MAPGADQAEITCHAQDKQRQGKDHPDNKFASLVPNLCIPGPLFGVFRVQSLNRSNGVEAGFFDGRDHVLDARDSRNVGHGGPLGGEIDRRCQHARNFFVQGPFDVHGAVGAGHSGDRKFNLGRADPVTRFFDFC